MGWLSAGGRPAGVTIARFRGLLLFCCSRLAASSRILEVIGLTILVIFATTLTMYRLGEPAWESGHQGFLLAQHATNARNLNRYGIVDSRLCLLTCYGDIPPSVDLVSDCGVRTDNPPLMHLLMAASYRVLGETEAASRLPAAVSSVSLVIVCYLVARRSLPWPQALLAGLFATLIPVRTIYGRLAEVIMLSVFLSLVTIYLFMIWQDTRRRRYLWAAGLCFLLSAFTGWNGYFAAVAVAFMLLVHSCRTGKRYVTLGAWFALAITAFAVHLAWAYRCGGEDQLRFLYDKFLFRTLSGGDPVYTFTTSELLGVMVERMPTSTTATLAILTIFGVAGSAWRMVRRRAGEFDVALLAVGVYWVSTILLLQNVVFIHDYFMYYPSVPFFSLAAVGGLRELIRRLPCCRWGAWLFFGVAALSFYIPQAIDVFRDYHDSAVGDVYREQVVVGRYLNRRTQAQDLVLFSIAPGHPRMRYYLDRQYKVVSDVGSLEAELGAGPSPFLYVLDAEATVSDDLRRHLFERYTVEEIESYAIFDLSSSSGNTFSTEPQASTEPVLSFDAPLQLLSATLSPDEVTPAPEPSLWQRYLNAHTELLSENQTRVTVEYMWQASVLPDQDYSVITRLVHVLTGEVAVEVRRRPLSGNLPTSLWHDGDVIGERFDVSLPSSAAPGRYRLEVELVDAKGKRISGILDPNRSWPDLRLEPRAPDAPVAEVPRACQPAGSTNTGTPFKVVGWCSNAETMDLYWQISEPSEQDFAATLVLATEGLTVEQEVGTLLATSWRAGQTYHSRVLLSSGLLPARYDARLVMRGDLTPGADLGTSPAADLGLVEVEGEAPLLLRRLGQPNTAVESGLRLDPESPLTIEYSLTHPHTLSLTISWPGMSELPETRVQVWLENDVWAWQPKLLRTIAIGAGRPSKTVIEIPDKLTVAGVNRITVEVADAGEAYFGWRRLAVTLVPKLKYFIRDSYQAYTGWVDIDYLDVALTSESYNRQDLRTVSQTYESLGLFSEALDYLDAFAGDTQATTMETALTRARLYTGMGEETAAVAAYRQVLASVLGSGDLSRENAGILIEALHTLVINTTVPAESRIYREALEELIPHYRPELLGGKIWYLGYDLASEGGDLTMNLYLFPVSPVDRAYTIWMHAEPDDPDVLPAERKQYGSMNLDHEPVVPTTSWDSYRLYVDETQVHLAEAYYEFDFGLWDSSSGERLLTASGDTGVVLGEECAGTVTQPVRYPAGVLDAARMGRALEFDNIALEYYRVLARELGKETISTEQDELILIESLANIASLTDDPTEAKEVSERLARLIPGYAPVNLGDAVLYLGGNVITESNQISVNLYFLPLTRMEEDFRIWMHAATDAEAALSGDRQESVFLNLDHNPTLETSSWKLGSLFVDKSTAQVEPACYELQFGLWRPEDKARLLTPDKEFGLFLGEVCVNDGR